MEIEAKFVVDAATLAALADLRALGPYELAATPHAEVQRNTYFDTADRRLSALRCGLRVRLVGERRVATLKRGGQVRDGVHERGEWEVELDAGDAPEQWPPSEARDQTLAVTGGAELLPVVLVRTTRRHLYASLQGRRVAELSLDEGAIEAGARALPFRELEIELLAGGDRADLDALIALLHEHFPLQPEDRSKLARGLELLGGSTGEKPVSPDPMTPTFLADEPPASRPTLPALALGLFDRTADAHRLSGSARRLAQLAATFYEAALHAGAEQPARSARDAALAAPIDGLSPNEQAVVAAATALMRERPRPSREPSLLRLPSGARRQALRLGALLRVASALQVGSTAAVHHGELTTVTLAWRDTEAARLVETRADLWRRAIGGLVVRQTPDGERLSELAPDDAPLSLEMTEVPDGLRGDEGVAEGARRVLRRFFERMLAREEEVRGGEEPEDVHQMRVSTRRLRASLQVTEGVFDAKVIREHRRGLQRVAQALGEVRDRDVFLGSLLAHQERLPEEERPIIEPLLAAVRVERGPARERLVATLGSKRYRRIKRAFAAFLTTPGADIGPLPETGVPPRVRDLAGSAIWRRYEQLRAFESIVGDTPDERLHVARIAGKRLRYALEFFADAIGPRVDEALAPLADLQEALGALQDAVVARAHVRALGLEQDPGAQGYLAALEETGARQGAELPRIWERATGESYRRLLAEIIVDI